MNADLIFDVNLHHVHSHVKMDSMQVGRIGLMFIQCELQTEPEIPQTTLHQSSFAWRSSDGGLGAGPS